MRSLLLVFALCLAVVSARRFKVFNSLTEVPEGWKLVGRKPLTNPEIEFTVALKPRNLDVLERELYKVSNPKDPQNYGKWWTRKQVQDLVAPELTEQLEVESWLKSYGMKVFRFFFPFYSPIFFFRRKFNRTFVFQSRFLSKAITKKFLDQSVQSRNCWIPNFTPLSGCLMEN